MLNASTLLQDYGLDDVISAVYTPLPLSSVVISDRRRDLQGQGRKVTWLVWAVLDGPMLYLYH